MSKPLQATFKPFIFRNQQSFINIEPTKPNKLYYFQDNVINCDQRINMINLHANYLL